MKSQFLSRIFRVMRVAVIVLVIIGLAVWLHGMLASVESDQAVINAEIMQIRAPIAGILEIAPVRAGTSLRKGASLFKITNPHFENSESAAQFNNLQNFVEVVQGELEGARHTLELAKLTDDRARRLFAKDVIAREETVQAAKGLEIAKNVVAAKTEQLARSRERVKEMERQVALEKTSVVTLPTDGLVWSVARKSGENVDANQVVMEVMNPKRIWVDAFFSERHIEDLHSGLPAIIRSLDGVATWPGQLQSIRAGVGRLSYDTTVAVPPPEMAKREIAVRIEGKWNRPFSAEEFYGVGRSVTVTFVRNPGQQTFGNLLQQRVRAALWGTKRSSETAQTGQ